MSCTAREAEQMGEIGFGWSLKCTADDDVQSCLVNCEAAEQCTDQPARVQAAGEYY